MVGALQGLLVASDSPCCPKIVPLGRCRRITHTPTHARRGAACAPCVGRPARDPGHHCAAAGHHDLQRPAGAVDCGAGVTAAMCVGFLLLLPIGTAGPGAGPVGCLPTPPSPCLRPCRCSCWPGWVEVIERKGHARKPPRPPFCPSMSQGHHAAPHLLGRRLYWAAHRQGQAACCRGGRPPRAAHAGDSAGR